MFKIHLVWQHCPLPKARSLPKTGRSNDPQLFPNVQDTNSQRKLCQEIMFIVVRPPDEAPWGIGRKQLVFSVPACKKGSLEVESIISYKMVFGRCCSLLIIGNIVRHISGWPMQTQLAMQIYTNTPPRACISSTENTSLTPCLLVSQEVAQTICLPEFRQSIETSLSLADPWWLRPLHSSFQPVSLDAGGAE